MEAGTWVVAVCASLALLVTFFLRTRLSTAAVVVILAAAGAGLGWGAMLLQPDPSTGEVVAAMAILAVVVPAHVRLVLGPFGPR